MPSTSVVFAHSLTLFELAQAISADLNNRRRNWSLSFSKPEKEGVSLDVFSDVCGNEHFTGSPGFYVGFLERGEDVWLYVHVYHELVGNMIHVREVKKDRTFPGRFSLSADAAKPSDIGFMVYVQLKIMAGYCD